MVKENYFLVCTFTRDIANIWCSRKTRIDNGETVENSPREIRPNGESNGLV